MFDRVALGTYAVLAIHLRPILKRAHCNYIAHDAMKLKFSSFFYYFKDFNQTRLATASSEPRRTSADEAVDTVRARPAVSARTRRAFVYICKKCTPMVTSMGAVLIIS